MDRSQIIAVDFDGTLCFSAWPDVGEPNNPLINYLKRRQKAGNKLILWTCRSGAALDEAVSWCREVADIEFDAVNDNVQYDYDERYAKAVRGFYDIWILNHATNPYGYSV